MKRKLFIVLTFIFLAGLMFASTALAVDEPWEEINRIPDDPSYYHYPKDTAHDSLGNFYVLGHNRVKRYTPDGLLDTSWCQDGILGGEYGSGIDEFDTPYSIAIDGADNLYIADTSNHRIKRYTAQGILDEFWSSDGIIGSYGSNDEQFNSPIGIAVDHLNNLYVSDSSNNRLKRYTPGGILDTSWGGGDGIIGNDVIPSLFIPTYIDLDAMGNLYIADLNNRVVRCTAGSVVDTSWGGGDGIVNCIKGIGGDAFLPKGIAVDNSERLYVSDNNHVIRYTSSGTLDTSWGGNGMIGTEGMGDEQFSIAKGLSVDASDDVYVCDNYRIKRYTSDGNLNITWCNSGIMSTGGTHMDQLLYPHDAVVDEYGNIYVADSVNNRIKRYTSSGSLDTSWGNGGIIGGTQGSGDDEFYDPRYVALDAQGNLYVLDQRNFRIKRYKPDGSLDTEWASGGMITESLGNGYNQFNFSWGFEVDASGYVYLSDSHNHRIKRYTPDGALDTSWGGGDGNLGAGSGSGLNQFDFPQGLAVDDSGNLYVLDAGNYRIKRYTNEGILDTSWGGGDGIIGGTEGDEIDQFKQPYDIAVNPQTGDIYVLDTLNNRIVQYTANGDSPRCIYQFSDSLEALDSPPLSTQTTIAFYQGRLYTVCMENHYMMVLYDVENGMKLGKLSVFGEPLTGFDPDVLEYTIVVSKNATHVDISAEPFYTNSTVSGAGTQALSSGNSTKLVITVAGEKGDTQDYILNVLRDGKDVSLTDLTVDGQIVPSFNEAKTSYTITLPYGREYLNIGAVGNKYCEEISGTGIVMLTGDTSVYSVSSKAIDGSVRVYTLTVKKGEMDASWISAAIDGQDFGSSGISIVVPEGGKTLMLRVTLEDGTYIDLPVTLSVKTSETTPTPEPTAQSTQSPVSTEVPESITDTSDDTSEDVQFTASVDGVEMGSSVEMVVPQSGKTVVITIKMPDGKTYDIPVELIPQSAAVNITDNSSSSLFAWWWIVICVLGAIAISLGVWVIFLKQK